MFLETKLRSNSAFLTRFKIQTSARVDGSFHTRRPDAIRKWPFRQQLTYDSLLAITYAMRAYYTEHGRFPPSRRCGMRTKSPLVDYFSKVRMNSVVFFRVHHHHHMFGQAIAQGRVFSLAVARSSRLHSFSRSGHLSRCCMVCSEVPHSQAVSAASS